MTYFNIFYNLSWILQKTSKLVLSPAQFCWLYIIHVGGPDYILMGHMVICAYWGMKMISILNVESAAASLT